MYCRQANNRKIQHIEEDRDKQQKSLEELEDKMKEIKTKKDESTAVLSERNKYDLDSLNLILQKRKDN